MPTTVDMEKIIREYGDTKLYSIQKEGIDLKNPVIVWTDMVVMNTPAVFKPDSGKSTIKTHTLFRSVFTNDTLSPQTYSVKNVRTTVNVMEVCLETSFKYGTETQMVLSDAVMSFDTTQQIRNMEVEGKPHELEWVIKMDVSVPPNLSTTLEVMVKEKEVEEDFEIVSAFDGTVRLIYLADDDHREKVKLDLKVRDMFTQKPHFFPDDKGRPCFITKGRLKNKLGTEQLVQLTEGPLPPKAN
ncbi:unnamed protein product [Lymnaea stagnalis]|uniref:Uncharacterized protein n=1 Tax=Lymnaea stagnalis TaxID=6523 RepID=A0AAV2I2T2_LYMST